VYLSGESRPSLASSFTIIAGAEGIGGVAELTRAAMAKASDLVLGGFVLRTDVNVVRYPARYSDKRGAAMWNRVLCLLSSDMAAQRKR